MLVPSWAMLGLVQFLHQCGLCWFSCGVIVGPRDAPTIADSTVAESIASSVGDVASEVAMDLVDLICLANVGNAMDVQLLHYCALHYMIANIIVACTFSGCKCLAHCHQPCDSH